MMRAIVTVTVDSGPSHPVGAIRNFVCKTNVCPDPEKNVLIEFNPLLDAALQEAFDAGRLYGQKEVAS